MVVGGALFRLVNALRDNDGRGPAVDTARTAGARLERATNLAAPAHLSIYGHLMLQGAMAAAAGQDQAAAAELLGQARTTAQRLGEDRNDYWTAFGPSNVLVHEVCALVEMREPGRAIQAAGTLPSEALARLPKERHAQHLVTLACAHSHAGEVPDAAVGRVLDKPLVRRTTDNFWPYRLHPTVREAVRATDADLSDHWSKAEWAAAARRACVRPRRRGGGRAAGGP